MIELTEFKENLKRYGQSHLISFWETLTPAQRQELYDDIQSLNLEEIMNIFRRNVLNKQDEGCKLDEYMLPIPEEIYGCVARTSPEKLLEYQQKGLREISEGRVAVLLLAGGQGTRLGVSYPKGMFDIGLPSHKSLYQIQAERLLKLRQLTRNLMGGVSRIVWYIMTSEHTKMATLDFFANHNYFGLNKEEVIIFEQGMLPCLTQDGLIIMESKYKISKAPDGNGGLYKALRDQNIFDHMTKQGIQHLHVYCVDNILIRMADPVFLGYCLTKGANCATKVVEKAFPTEALGVVCQVGSKYRVVEYSEITLETAQKRNLDGRLTFGAGNICVHYFSVSFLRKFCEDASSAMRYHIAKKKIPFVNSDGMTIIPLKINGIKLEKFIFDIFPSSDRFVIWEVLREDEFAPLKNGDLAEKDTPTSVRQALFSLHQRYILAAGGNFVDENGDRVPLIPRYSLFNKTLYDDLLSTNNQKSCLKYEQYIVCEISPLITYGGEGLEPYVMGKTLILPFVLYHPSEKNSNSSDEFQTSCANNAT